MVYHGRYDELREAPCGAAPRPGDIVMLRNGWTPMLVTQVERSRSSTMITASYGMNANSEPKVRQSRDFILICQEGEECPERFRTEVRERHGIQVYTDEELRRRRDYRWEASLDGTVRHIKEDVRPRHEVKVNIEVPELTASEQLMRDRMVKDVIERNEEQVRKAMGLTRPLLKEPIFPKIRMNWPEVFGYDLGEKDMEPDYTEPTDLSGKLFETEDGRFGTYLTENSAGKYVLEMKGKDGDVEAFEPDKITLVRPHTILVKRISTHPQRLQWQAKKGVVEEGDLLINKDGTRYVVLDVDTQADTDRKAPEGLRKIPTEPIDL